MILLPGIWPAMALTPMSKVPAEPHFSILALEVAQLSGPAATSPQVSRANSGDTNWHCTFQSHSPPIKATTTQQVPVHWVISSNPAIFKHHLLWALLIVYVCGFQASWGPSQAPRTAKAQLYGPHLSCFLLKSPCRRYLWGCTSANNLPRQLSRKRWHLKLTAWVCRDSI